MQGETICRHVALHFFKFEDRSVHLHHILQLEDKGVQAQRYAKLNQASEFFPNNTECCNCKILTYFGNKCLYVKICVMYALRIKEWQKYHGKIVKLNLPKTSNQLPNRVTSSLPNIKHVGTTSFTGSYGFYVIRDYY